MSQKPDRVFLELPESHPRGDFSYLGHRFIRKGPIAVRFRTAEERRLDLQVGLEITATPTTAAALKKCSERQRKALARAQGCELEDLAQSLGFAEPKTTTEKEA
jgi:hypothetical protein